MAKPILIAGGGLASLLLARSLLRSGLPFQVFERDESFAFRGQGYRLRLSTEGLDAIESALDEESFRKFWDKCGKTGGLGYVAYDALSGDVTETSMSENLASRGGKIVGIARGDMREVFAEGLEKYIVWGKKVTGYEHVDASDNEKGVRLLFADGTKSVEGSLIVGGEGIYSHVARQVSEGKIKTYDTGARGIHGQAPSSAFKALGEGVFRAVDESRPEGSVFMITNVRPGGLEDPDVQFGWTMGGHPGVIRAPNDDYSIVGAQAAELAQSLTKQWHPRLKSLFDEMITSEAAFWKITCTSPSGVPSWTNDPLVTVIGDAVHSMTPAGGIGANTAVRDSALLGKLLHEAGGNRPGLTAEYEAQMRVYASEAVNQSYTLAKQGFGVNIEEGVTPTV